MRPVTRGSAPVSTFSNYRDAAEPLRTAIDEYCSYCERWIPTNLAIEHIQPKSIHLSLLNSWDNFLFACVNCNSSKGSTPVQLQDYYWPDSDNTMRGISYTFGGMVVPAQGLGRTEQDTANRTIKLFGLDKDPGHVNPLRRPTEADLRWKHRLDRWDCAQKSKQRLLAEDSAEMREQIVETARSRGSFGIWFVVFYSDRDMRLRLIDAFCGTARDCFDPDGNPIPRPGGKI
jgi:uncharacterized protein (TIGR02646 family)